MVRSSDSFHVVHEKMSNDLLSFMEVNWTTQFPESFLALIKDAVLFLTIIRGEMRQSGNRQWKILHQLSG